MLATKRENTQSWERRRSSLQDEPSAPSTAPATRGPLIWWIGLAATALAVALPLTGTHVLRRDDVAAEAAPVAGRLLAASITEGRSETIIPLDGLPAAAVLSPAGDTAYVSLYDRNAIAIVDLRTRRPLAYIPVVERPGRLAISPDGTRLIIAGRSELGLLDIQGRKLTRFVPETGTISDVHVPGDWGSVWVALGQGGLKILDIETGRWDTLTTVGCPMYMAAAPRSERLFVSYQCGGPGGSEGHDAVEIIDIPRRRPIVARAELPLVGGKLAVSPDEEHLWVDSSDACTARYDQVGCPPGSGPVLHALRTATLEKLLTIRVPGPMSNSTPIFFPDGTRLAVAGGGGLRVIDRALGTILESMNRPVLAGAFTGDGQRFVAIEKGRRGLVEFELSPAPDPVMLRGLASHWTGDGTASEVVASGLDTVQTDGLRFESGRFGQAFSFDGASAGVSFGRRLNADIVNDTTATYAAWIKPRRFGTLMHIASRTTPFGWQWVVGADGRVGLCFAQAARDLACVTGGLASRSVLQAGRWAHVAIVRNASTLTLFLDGREDGSMQIMPGFEPREPEPDADLRLGAGLDGAAPFDGLIDEVVLFRRSMSSADISALMRATTLPFSALRQGVMTSR